MICQINIWHVPIVQEDWLRFSYPLPFVIRFLLITLVALCKPLRMYTSLLSFHFSAKRLFLWQKTVSPCFNLAWVTAKVSDFQFFLTVPYVYVFLFTTNQSSWGYCNNYQNKHDDPCPTTVLNLTNLGQCKKFLMHPVIPVHDPVTGQMHLLYKLQSHKCSQC